MDRERKRERERDKQKREREREKERRERVYVEVCVYVNVCYKRGKKESGYQRGIRKIFVSVYYCLPREHNIGSTCIHQTLHVTLFASSKNVLCAQYVDIINKFVLCHFKA